MMGVRDPGPDDPRALTPEITVIDEQVRRVWSVFDGEYMIPEDRHEVETDGK